MTEMDETWIENGQADVIILSESDNLFIYDSYNKWLHIIKVYDVNFKYSQLVFITTATVVTSDHSNPPSTSMNRLLTPSLWSNKQSHAAEPKVWMSKIHQIPLQCDPTGSLSCLSAGESWEWCSHEFIYAWDQNRNHQYEASREGWSGQSEPTGSNHRPRRSKVQ